MPRDERSNDCQNARDKVNLHPSILSDDDDDFIQIFFFASCVLILYALAFIIHIFGDGLSSGGGGGN